MEGVDFLSFLRDKNPVAADQRYARLLAMSEADLKSDANTISLLSSYLFTPHLTLLRIGWRPKLFTKRAGAHRRPR